jgi:TolA-binding protein
LKKTYLLLCLLLLLALIVSCSGVPKSNEQAPTELAIAESITDAEPVSELAEINQPEAVPEESVFAEEEKPQTEYVTALSLLDDHQKTAEETDPQPTDQPVIAMETLQPAGAASPVEPVSPPETLPKPATPALPERRTAQIVPPDFSPPIRESWRQLPKDESPSVVQEPPPIPEDIPEERILQPDYPITFSRTARVTVGQLVEIPFRGRDWVFIGEVGARRGIAYDSRKMDPEGESFIFRVEAAGVYALKFYRQDFARDLILNDHVQIIAGGAPETTGLGWFNPPTDRSRVVAGPRWPNFLEPQPSPKDVEPEVRGSPLEPSQKIDSHAEQLSHPIEELGVQPPTTVQPPTATQAPATVRPPATAQPPRPATVQPPVRQPSNTRNETARPQTPSGDAVAQAGPAQSQSPPVPKETTAPKETQPAQVAEPVSPDSILKQARDEFNAGRIASAITLLDQFCKSLPSGSDEAWWLYGQCFEANSPNRNMLSALEYYRRLVREYPQSSRLNDARRRIAYLERYYINIQ